MRCGASRLSKIDSALCRPPRNSSAALAALPITTSSAEEERQRKGPGQLVGWMRSACIGDDRRSREGAEGTIATLARSSVPKDNRFSLLSWQAPPRNSEMLAAPKILMGSGVGLSGEGGVRECPSVQLELFAGVDDSGESVPKRHSQPTTTTDLDCLECPARVIVAQHRFKALQTSQVEDPAETRKTPRWSLFQHIPTVCVSHSFLPSSDTSSGSLATKGVERWVRVIGFLSPRGCLNSRYQIIEKFFLPV